MFNRSSQQACVKDVVDAWYEEAQEAKHNLEIIRAIVAGDLPYIDPVIELDCIDTEESLQKFLDNNVGYGFITLRNGERKISKISYFDSMHEYSIFEKNVKNESYLFGLAISHFFITRESFKKWLIDSDRFLPAFWFSPAERSEHPTSLARAQAKVLALTLFDPEYKESISKSLEELRERQNVPSILHEWFKHDTWKANEGLMLLSGLCPTTVFERDENFLGAPIRDVIQISTLDGFERDPQISAAYIGEFEMYERLWHSGDHPARATPKYFIEWAISKNIEPTWLKWVTENGYFSPKMSKNDTQKEVSGKSEIGYLNIIGALVGLVLEKTDPDGNRYSIFKDQQAIINAIEENFGTEGGLSESNLQKKFALAKKSINSK